MTPDDRPVFRFAPSPNGELHLGHALSALDGYEQAKAAGGRFLLRIEDIDIGRTRPEFVAGIFEDLRWLGLEWEEPVLFQSQRMDAYRAAAGRLAALGLLYPCFATRSEIEAAVTDGASDPDGAPLYPGLWKGRSASGDRGEAGGWGVPGAAYRHGGRVETRDGKAARRAADVCRDGRAMARGRLSRRTPSDGAMP